MVTPSYYPIKGGAETIIHDLSAKLNEIGISTHILTFNMDRKWNPRWQGKIERDDKITVYKIPALNWLPMEHSNRITLGINLIPGRFKKIVKNYDLMHFHGGDLTFPLFSCMIRKPKLFHFHGLSWEFCRRNPMSKLILKNIAHLYICLTNHMKKGIIKLGMPEEKIRILPNGVDAEFFYPAGKKEENLVLFVGRICPEKGVHILLESLAYVKTPIKLIIIGPPEWNLTYFNFLMKLIKRENNRGKHKVLYLGAKDKEEIVEWYRKASIFVLPSYREGFGVVILEALACETPVIATNVDGIPEILHDNTCGILVPPGTPQGLARAIQFLLDNKDIRVKLGRQGRTIIQKRFSLNIVVSRVCKIYSEVLSKFDDKP